MAAAVIVRIPVLGRSGDGRDKGLKHKDRTMNISKVSDYRFYTTAEIKNPYHDRRHRHGIEAKATIPAGTQVRVEATALFSESGEQVGTPIKHYHLFGRSVGLMTEALAAMDPGHDESPRSLDDLAARNFASREWFAYAVVEKLLASGGLTFEQVQEAWDATEEVQS